MPAAGPRPGGEPPARGGTHTRRGAPEEAPTRRERPPSGDAGTSARPKHPTRADCRPQLSPAACPVPPRARERHQGGRSRERRRGSGAERAGTYPHGASPRGRGAAGPAGRLSPAVPGCGAEACGCGGQEAESGQRLPGPGAPLTIPRSGPLPPRLAGVA